MKCCQPGKFIKDSVPRVCARDLLCWHPLHSTYPKVQIPRRKAGGYHKLQCLCKQFRDSEPRLSVLGMVGTFPKFKVPDASQGQPCKQTFQRMLTLVHRWGCGWKVRMVADTPARGEEVCSCSFRAWCCRNFPSDQSRGAGEGTWVLHSDLRFRMISGIPLLQGQRRKARVRLG